MRSTLLRRCAAARRRGRRRAARARPRRPGSSASTARCSAASIVGAVVALELTAALAASRRRRTRHRARPRGGARRSTRSRAPAQLGHESVRARQRGAALGRVDEADGDRLQRPRPVSAAARARPGTARRAAAAAAVLPGEHAAGRPAVGRADDDQARLELPGQRVQRARDRQVLEHARLDAQVLTDARAWPRPCARRCPAPGTDPTSPRRAPRGRRRRRSPVRR